MYTLHIAGFKERPGKHNAIHTHRSIQQEIGKGSGHWKFRKKGKQLHGMYKLVARIVLVRIPINSDHTTTVYVNAASLLSIHNYPASTEVMVVYTQALQAT